MLRRAEVLAWGQLQEDFHRAPRGPMAAGAGTALKKNLGDGPAQA